MHRLIAIRSSKDIPSAYRGKPIGRLLEYHNLSRPLDPCSQARLLIGMCMDSRKSLRIPDNFAFILRAGGANLRYSEFKVSYAIAIGGVSSIALIGHNRCGMVNIASRKAPFIRGLVERGGWTRKEAQEHFTNFSTVFEIGSETDFILSEVKRLRLRYPKVTVAPMLYSVDDNRLYLLREN